MVPPEKREGRVTKGFARILSLLSTRRRYPCSAASSASQRAQQWIPAANPGASHLRMVDRAGVFIQRRAVALCPEHNRRTVCRSDRAMSCPPFHFRSALHDSRCRLIRSVASFAAGDRQRAFHRCRGIHDAKALGFTCDERARRPHHCHCHFCCACKRGHHLKAFV